MIAIIDYGVGNPGSIRNMLKKLGAVSEITCDPQRIQAANKLILPGVGAFDTGMARLHASGLVPVLDEMVMHARTPILGICLGMQMMTDGSQEGHAKGLGWVPGGAFHLSRLANPPLKIPHMGWNAVKSEGKHDQPLVAEEQRFYFVHSYYVALENETSTSLTAVYGKTFCAAFQQENIYGVQFHPEKSHRFGLKLLQRFEAL
jgi:imidazole glycerol-phosphate synthase subunit HisH